MGLDEPPGVPGQVVQHVLGGVVAQPGGGLPGGEASPPARQRI